MNSKKRLLVGLALSLLLALVLLIGVMVYLLALPVEDFNSPDMTNHSQLKPKDLERIYELRNVGIAQLENSQWSKSAELFRELAEILPESHLAHKNLAIAQSMFFLKLDGGASEQKEEQAFQSAMQSIQEFRQFSPDDPVSYRLQARIMEKRLEPEKAVALLVKSAELFENDPTIWFEINQASLASRDPQTVATGRDALNNLHALAPENIFGFIKWMVSISRENDPPLQQIVEELDGLITPLATGIQIRTGYDLQEFVQEVTKNFEEGNFSAAKSGMLRIHHVINGDDVSNSDRNLLIEHGLEFVEFRFSSELESELEELAGKSNQTEIKVVFQSAGNLPQLDHPAVQTHLVDFNLDGIVDILVLTKASFQVFSKEANDEEWAEIYSRELDRSYDHFVVADLDYDRQDTATPEGEKPTIRPTADLDLIFFGETGVGVYETKLSSIGGDVSIEKVSGLEKLEQLLGVSLVLPSDLNNDGDLDLAVISEGKVSYWNNQNNFEFVQKPLDSALDEKTVVDCIAIDWDRDIDIDLLLLLSDGTLGFLESYRHGTFRWNVFEETFSHGDPTVFEIVDADKNGSWDIIAGGTSGIEIFLTMIPQTGKVTFTKLNQISGNSCGALFDIDYDNDGHRDIAYISADKVHLLKGGDAASFTESKDLIAGAKSQVDSLATGDFDADGDTDLVTISNGAARFISNEGGNQNPWLDLGLVAAHVEGKGGADSQKNNYYGFGSIVEIRAGRAFQQMLVKSPITKFGLGSLEHADAIRVVWTNGIPQNFLRPTSNQTIWEGQKLLGSCPYLYTWNGEKFVFVTDLLWASPIGLQNPAGELVPSRPWEYLKIPGEALQAKDGTYALQITEELWEIAYFDQIELIAIDHPADVDIFTNEKVGPPEIAEHRLYQVREKRSPVSVRNHLGRDLLPEVLDRDHIYAKPFERKLMQGYTDDSYVEIDFGLKSKPENLTLFLTGWIFPTDTGLNVALHENSQLPGPQPPAILAPNEKGEFVEVIPYCGFPGGKTKTMAIDLADVFPTDDHRIRLSTSMELYWDQIFFSTENIDEELIVQPLTCSSADLHHRGVSRIQHSDNHGPENFVYEQINTVTPWPAIAGKLTRYGDILELITQTDDQLAIIGAGDEMTLKFSLPEKPLKSGWKRDFVLHNVGWDKDANLHTITGQTVEPLPFVKMKSYPYHGEEQAPHSPEYLRKYQTREMSPDAFRTVLRRSSLTELEATLPIPSNGGSE